MVPAASQFTSLMKTKITPATALTIRARTFLSPLIRGRLSVSPTPSTPISSTPWAAPK